jgi:succinate dehydrogenase (ubiquinone) membrane anchor subunit
VIDAKSDAIARMGSHAGTARAGRARDSAHRRRARCDGERLTDERRAGDGTQIISDYVPKGARGPTRAATLALTAATAVGLFKLNTQGDGITRTVKSLWKA